MSAPAKTLSRDQLLELLKPYQDEYAKLGQEHVFKNIDKVSDSNLANLYDSVQNFSLSFLMNAYHGFSGNGASSHSEGFSPYSSHGLDLSRLDDEKIYAEAINSLQSNKGSARLEFLKTYTPTAKPNITEPSQDDLNFYLYTALEALIRGEAGSLVLAGGQGTRLKFDKPKAMFPVETPSDQTVLMRILYSQQLITHLARQYYETTYPSGGEGLPASSQDVSIPLIFLTSPQTHADMHAYFDNIHQQITTQTEIKFPPATVPVWLTEDLLSNVYFIQQASLPAVTLDGKLVLSDDKLLMSPNGNGGMYGALFPLFEKLREGTVCPPYPCPTHHTHPNTEPHNTKYNLKHIMSLNIDNICNKVCDPIMLGYTIAHKVDVSVKTVPKTSPTERVGVVGVKNGRVQMVEYTEIKEAANERDERGVLRYIDGNTNITVYSTDFLFKARSALTAALSSCGGAPCDNGMPLHRADKQAKVMRNTERFGEKEPVEQTRDIIKFELFAFDAFTSADHVTVIRTNRNSHFLPLKSKDNPDPTKIDPDTPRYCFDRANKVTTRTLLRRGFTVLDVNGKRIVNSPGSSGDDGEQLDQLGYRYEKPDEAQSGNEPPAQEVALSLAQFGQGIELDVTQFYGFGYPAFDVHPHTDTRPRETIFDTLYPEAAEIITETLLDHNKIIGLSNEYAMIFHADGSITKSSLGQFTPAPP